MSTLMTTADLPAGLTARAEPETRPPTRVRVLTCEHGPACPECVLAAARALVKRDATLTGDVPVYTG